MDTSNLEVVVCKEKGGSEYRPRQYFTLFELCNLKFFG